MFKWFEEAFEGVRLELQTLIASMTHQQAMLAELLDSRQAELRLALVAESLPDVVGDAVRAAMDDHNTAMAEAYDKSHDRFRDDVERVRATTEAKVDSLQESFEKLESVIAVHDEEAEQRETVRLGTLKGSVTRQITPITDALSRLAAKLDDITARLDTPSAAASGAGQPSARIRPSRPVARTDGRRPTLRPRPPAPVPLVPPDAASAAAPARRPRPPVAPDLPPRPEPRPRLPPAPRPPRHGPRPRLVPRPRPGPQRRAAGSRASAWAPGRRRRSGRCPAGHVQPGRRQPPRQRRGRADGHLLPRPSARPPPAAEPR